MFELTERERRLLTVISLMLCGGSIALLPLTAESARNESRPIDARSASSPWAPPAVTYAALRVSRDPFQPFRGTMPLAPALAGADSSEMALPPNAGAVIVRAVVLGPQSRALVEIGGRVNVLGVGDELASGTIASIDERGVVLSSGARIPLTKDRP